MQQKDIFDLLFKNNAAPGQKVAGEGVFVGQYEVRDGGLGRIFNVYAAPEDLTDETGENKAFTYVEAVKRIAELRGWNGFDGAYYKDSAKIHAALMDGSYAGGWVIPPRELLSGVKAQEYLKPRACSKIVQHDNLFEHCFRGAFKGTFTRAAAEKYHEPVLYWSSTLKRREGHYGDFVFDIDFSDGAESFDLADSRRLSCRPVRFVPVE